MNTHIIFSEVSGLSDSIDCEFLSLVSNERQERINKFRFVIDRKLCLYSELLVRNQACKELGISNEEIIFERNKSGKPFLLNYPKFQFNISHTRNAIAAAFSSNEIGVDIESIKPSDLAIANRFFTPSEQEYITSHDNPDYAFYEVWTKKEAYIKHNGTGLSMPLNSFDVLDNQLKAMLQTFTIDTYIISTCYNDLFDIGKALKSMKENELQLLFSKIR